MEKNVYLFLRLIHIDLRWMNNMKKIVVETLHVVRYYCDICGKEIDRDQESEQYCEICDRMICEHCTVYIDAHRMICKICESISKEYVNDINNSIETYDSWKEAAVNTVHGRWRRESLNIMVE